MNRLIIIGVVCVALLGGIILYVNTRTHQAQISDQKVSQQLDTQATDFSLWKKYTNEVGEYEIQYPPELAEKVDEQIRRHEIEKEGGFNNAAFDLSGILNISPVLNGPKYGTALDGQQLVSSTEEFEKIVESNLADVRKAFASTTVEFKKMRRNFNGYSAVSIDSMTPIDYDKSLIYHKIFILHDSHIYVVFYDDYLNKRGELVSQPVLMQMLSSFKFID